MDLAWKTVSEQIRLGTFVLSIEYTENRPFLIKKVMIAASEVERLVYEDYGLVVTLKTGEEIVYEPGTVKQFGMERYA